MTTTPTPRMRRMHDRCEVCQRVLDHRPDPTRPRCADHLGQLALFPRRAVRKPRRWPTPPGTARAMGGEGA